MIELINVSKYYPTDFGRHYVFRDVSLLLPLDKSVGVLGPNGAGKSTFLRLLGGADIPSEGKIIKTGRISPPMGLTPGLETTLTAAENTRFAGRIYGLSRGEINDMIEYVRDLAGIGKFFDLPVSTYSAGMRQRVAFAINMSMEFDYYLFDEIGAGGDKEFRKITTQMVRERLNTSKFIIASHRIDELLEICDSGIVIQNGELTFFDDIRDALAAYGETEGADSARQARGRRQPMASGDGTEDASRQARRESILAKRELMKQQRTERQARRLSLAAAQPPEQPPAGAPDGSPATELSPAPETPAGEPPAEGENLDLRIARLRAARDQMQARRIAQTRAAKADDAGNTGTDLPDRPEDEARSGAEGEVQSGADPSLPAGKDSRRDRVKRLQLKREMLEVQRLERQIAREHQWAALAGTGPSASASPAGAAAANAEPEDDSARLRLALQCQARAQIKSARAARLLLRHLDSLDGEGGDDREGGRAALVALAQESAAREAAEARAMRDGSLSAAAPGGLAVPRRKPGHHNTARDGAKADANRHGRQPRLVNSDI